MSGLQRGHYTGMDSLVRCHICMEKLREYRAIFPQASNQDDPITKKPRMLGGAR